MWNKKRDKIFLFYIECGNGIRPYREPRTIQIGVLSVATFLKEKGYQVQVFFDSYPDTEDIKRLLSLERVRLVGFYTTMDNIFRVQLLTSMIKEKFPGIKVIFGGPQATVNPAELLKGGQADIVVRYEGEYTMAELLNYYFTDEGKLEDIQGITYRDGDSIKSNKDRPFIENLDDLPILDRDLIPYKEYLPAILTGRGCPYNCTFCFQGTGQYYRMRSVEHIMKEVDYLLERYKDPVYMSFIDDVLIADVEKASALFKEIKKRRELRPGIHLYAEVRVNIICQYPELIREMKEAGFETIQFGIESASEKMLKLYKKMITTEQVEFTVKKCVEEDIFQISTTFILGGPFESRETIEESINFAKKLIRMAPGRITIIDGYLTPLPGTPIGDKPEEYGIILLKPLFRIGGAGGGDCLSETVNLKAGELMELKDLFDRELMNTMVEEVPNITRHHVKRLFYMVREGIQSPWYDLLVTNMAIKRYFTFKEHFIYKTFDELSVKELEEYFPQRTDLHFELTQEEVTLDRFGRKYSFNNFQKRIHHLSAGKIRFKEIVEIIFKEFSQFSSEEMAGEETIKFYKKLDDIYGIVFAQI